MVKLLPGVRLNIGGLGVSTSFGGPARPSTSAVSRASRSASQDRACPTVARCSVPVDRRRRRQVPEASSRC
ncbi:hypothetical protein [Sphingomonas sp.]|uniref:hypothetical protein n=1 Tax=Sphingomonas sp. TaxID=28214 RepID=UPI003B0014A9